MVVASPYLERIQRKLAQHGEHYPLDTLREISFYEPRGAARELFRCREKEVLIEGPAGTGKSRAILEKLHRCCEKYPGIRCLLVRQTKESIPETVLPIYEHYVLGPSSTIKEGPNTHNRQFYLYPNGSSIVVGGLDKPVKIMSSEYDLIAIFEATEVSLDAYEYLLTRLRSYKMPYQQAMLDCNPEAPFHWLNLRPEQPHIKDPTKKQMVRLRSRHEDNPFLYDEEAQDWTVEGREYIENLDGLTGARKQRLRYGRWSAAEGAVYEDDWDPRIHVVDAPPDMRHMRRIFASLDWGFTNPGVLLVWGLDFDSRMYCLAQVYRRHKRNSWWIAKAKELRQRFPFEVIVADPENAEGIDEYRAQGLRVVEAVNSVQLGIQHVQERLRVAGDGKPRLMYVRDCLDAGGGRDEELVEDALPCSTEQEFQVYAWPKGQDGKPIKEVPVKINDHGMDATRYGVMYADGFARSSKARVDVTGLVRPASMGRPKRKPWEKRR